MPTMSPKFAPRCGETAIPKSKWLNTGRKRGTWKLSSAKFAPRCGERVIMKSKPLKHQGLGALFEVQTAFRVAGAGVREACKNFGRRGGFEEGPQRCFWHGRRKDFVLCEVDVSCVGRSICGRVANFRFRTCYFAGMISRGSYRTSYASAELFPGKRNTFEAST